jgi:glutamate 5-kinase
MQTNENFLEKPEIKKIHIKIGTQGILPQGYVDSAKLAKYVYDIVYLRSIGKSAYFTSSGAIAMGRNTIQKYNDITHETREEKRRLASIGQPNLIHSWENELYKHKLHASQILVDYADLKNEKNIAYTQGLIDDCLSNSTIPIINYNDAKDVDEICLDNDVLASQITWKMKNNILVILKSTNGLYDIRKQLVKDAISFDIKDYELRENSDCGRGGLETTLLAAKECNDHNIPCIISNYDFKIQDILKGDVERTVFQIYPKTLFSEIK